METLATKARKIAETMHTGQADKAGRPYITHPQRVAARCQGHPEAVAVGWLHDVVEDTPLSLNDLRSSGFPESVVNAVDAITMRAGEDRGTYYSRVAANPLALEVKLADIADNSDPQRLADLDGTTRDRLSVKYAEARAHLAQAAAGV